MPKLIPLLSLTLFFLFGTSATAQTDISLIEINHIGADNLSLIKHHEKVDWWVEMGDKMVVSFNDSDTPLPVFTRILATQKGVNLSELAFKSTGHCSNGDPQDKEHTSEVKINHKVHSQLETYFTSGGFNLVSTAGVKNKSELIAHNEITPFEKNKVLIYQLKNRAISHTKSDVDIQSLVNMVDTNRYFAQLETLASHDRLSEEGMVAAGEWLEAEFENLGLTTSRMDLHDHTGFNVLGFKQGTTKPDNWYVVGAHLDSRNQTFDETLPSPGAEDNASGCAGVLEVANVISQFQTESSVLFICFNAEERGLWGSGDVVTLLNDAGDLDKVKFMQNMDMISYRNGNVRTMNVGTDKEDFVLFAEMLAANGDLYTDINWQINPSACCTDFKSFSDAGIPSISSTIPDVTAYADYHETTDLPQNLDKIQGAGVVKAHLATLAEFVNVSMDTGFPITPAHSGMWFNPEQSGHGMTVEILADNRILVVWFVFDQLGNQIWLVGVGNYVGSTATVEVAISELGLFPPDFVSGDVISSLWGVLTFDFIDCDSVDFSWIPADDIDYPTGSMQLSRLTVIEGMSCEQ